MTDSKSGADITAQVLTQIILELDTPKIDSFPVPLLLRMIRSNDLAVRDFVENYFNQAFKAFSEYQNQMEERMRQMQQVTGVFPPFEAWSQAAMSPFGVPFGMKPAAAPAQPGVRAVWRVPGSPEFGGRTSKTTRCHAGGIEGKTPKARQQVTAPENNLCKCTNSFLTFP